MVADWGTKDPAIKEILERLQGSVQIPFLAIFPAGHPENVITVPGNEVAAILLPGNSGKLHAKLREAGPSKSAAGNPAEAKVSGAKERRPEFSITRLP